MAKLYFYHLTDVEFEVGDSLLPQDDGYPHWEDNNALESVLERFRPNDKLNRKESVFLVKDKPNGICDFGESGNTFLVTVELSCDTLQQQSDIQWIAPLDQGFDDVAILEDDYTPSQLAAIADKYWSGEVSPIKSKLEYRAPFAIVHKIERMSKLYDNK